MLNGIGGTSLYAVPLVAVSRAKVVLILPQRSTANHFKSGL